MLGPAVTAASVDAQPPSKVAVTGRHGGIQVFCEGLVRSFRQIADRGIKHGATRQSDLAKSQVAIACRGRYSHWYAG
jgi:hypothetical protein